MTTKKQPVPTLRNLLSAAVACLILAIGCASPTTEITATNTPTLAAATAEAATETATPTRNPVAMEVTEDSDLFINHFEALKAKYVVGNDTEFTQLPEFIEVQDGHQIWVSEGTITDRESMTIYPTGSIVIFSASGEAFVFKNNIDFEEVEDPGFGYTMSFQTDENGNPIADPFNDNSLTLIATFDGDPNEPALVWHPEGGEDGSGAWVEEAEKEYETAFEAVMTLFENEPTYQYQNLAAYASKDWEEETGYPQSVLQEKEGIEPGAFGKAILDVLKPAAIANGITAIDLEDGKIKTFNMTEEEFDDYNFNVFVDTDESDSPVLLSPNAQEVTKLDLFIRMCSGEQLRRVGIFYDKEGGFFVYIKVKPGMHNSPKDERRKDRFGGNITTAGALLATKPEDILHAYSHREGDSAELEREQAEKILLITRALFKQGEWLFQ